MTKKNAWKVEQELIDRFLSVLDDNGFWWVSGARANDIKRTWEDATLLIIEDEPKTLSYMEYGHYRKDVEEFNITEVTEKLLRDMEREGAANAIVSDDPVNHPSHYNHGELETITIIEMMLTEEEYRGYLKGNILKYQARAPYKGNAEQDYAKAKWYFDELMRVGY